MDRTSLILPEHVQFNLFISEPIINLFIKNVGANIVDF